MCRTLIYGLQTYHASHYGRKMFREIFKKSGALPPTVIGFLAATSKPTTLAIMVEKQVGTLSKNSAALPITGCRTLIYDLQTYHSSRYGRKIFRETFKKSGALRPTVVDFLSTASKPTTLAIMVEKEVGHCQKTQPHYHLRGAELLSTTSKPTTPAIMVEK